MHRSLWIPLLAACGLVVGLLLALSSRSGDVPPGAPAASPTDAASSPESGAVPGDHARPEVRPVNDTQVLELVSGAMRDPLVIRLAFIGSNPATPLDERIDQGCGCPGNLFGSRTR